MLGISCLTFLLGTFLHCVASKSTTRIVAKAPVKPVKEGEILSLHCQVWDIPENHVVTVARRIGGSDENMSWGKGVVQGVNDRTYLAVRQLRDGSSVYFLTITEVTKKDEGIYQCQVVHQGSFNVSGKHSVHIPIQYFPEEKPKCAPQDLPMRYTEGKNINLTCSSVTGYPRVKISWVRSGVDITALSTQTEGEDGITRSSLSFTLTEKDDDAVFMCLVTSSAFRGRENRCHVGPITVEPNPDPNWEYKPGRDITLSPPPVITHPPIIPQPPNKKPPKNVGQQPEDCTDVCRSPPTVKYWILACSAAGALALIFLISVMVLLIKYCQSASKETQTSQRRKGKNLKHHTTDEIYTELEYHRDQQRVAEANKVYMSLQKHQLQQPVQSVPEQQHLQATVEEEEPEGRDFSGTTGVPTATPVVYKSHYV